MFGRKMLEFDGESPTEPQGMSHAIGYAYLVWLAPALGHTNFPCCRKIRLVLCLLAGFFPVQTLDAGRTR